MAVDRAAAGDVGVERAAGLARGGLERVLVANALEAKLERIVGRELGVTQERVRQLEEKALRRLAADRSLAAWREAA